MSCQLRARGMGPMFGAPGYARLSYALGDDDLAEGVARIAKLLGER